MIKGKTISKGNFCYYYDEARLYMVHQFRIILGPESYEKYS